MIADKTGFIVTAGGYNPRMADIIAENISETQAINLVDNIFEYYKEYAEDGEKL